MPRRSQGLILLGFGLVLALLMSSPQVYAATIPQDDPRLAAEKLIAEAKQLRAQRSPGALKQAIQKLEEALPFVRALGDRPLEAEVLDQIGVVHDVLSDFPKALDNFGLALRIYETIGNRKREVNSLIGWYYGNTG